MAASYFEAAGTDGATMVNIGTAAHNVLILAAYTDSVRCRYHSVVV